MNDIKNLMSNQRLPFVYGVELTLGANASGTTQLNIQSDSSFLWTGLFGMSDQDDATDFFPNNFKIQLTDQSTGRNLSNIKIPQKLIAAPTNQKAQLFQPVVFMPNSTIVFDVENLVGSQAVVTLALMGYKLFNF